ncbi:adaptin ear-binding coat-associated protein 2 [Anopheles darlingi]|uniref:Adaptin ear-binding coat-associated protein 2 n=1 Tax=Anopheles darlingi TaxID=43151 RepID=W5JNR6_ANODA|nr:NECAP-like protein CG9132 [Anopheles darlingi]ETN64540.1 adaptin ear-binding coat-associated protein 2 [Anopheles darlingi]
MASETGEYESVVLVKQEVFVYKIPPRQSNRSYRAADWNLTEPIWTGRLRMVSKGRSLCVKLEDKTSGSLFANCPIESYPGVAIEAVSDSSRYFVLRIQDDNGRTAFIGLGFGDRSDSFDLNVALQDHFKWVKNEEKIEKEKVEPKQQLDLGFKEGETIKINMKITKKDGSEVSSRLNNKKAASGGLLPPPPGGNKINSGTPGSTSSPSHQPSATLNAGAAAATGGAQTEWGEFTSAGVQSGTGDPAATATTPSKTNANWVQF